MEFRITTLILIVFFFGIWWIIRQRFKEEEKKKQEIRCPVCKEKFFTSSDLNQHMKDYHKS